MDLGEAIRVVRDEMLVGGLPRHQAHALRVLLREAQNSIGPISMAVYQGREKIREGFIARNARHYVIHLPVKHRERRS